MAIAVLLLQSQLGAAPPLIQLTASVLVGAVAYGATLWWLQRDVVIRLNSQLRAAFGSR
jgi:hypothetical protein